MFTYDDFLKNKNQQKNQHESQKIIHKNSNISDIKGNTTVDSDFTSVNKNKTPLLINNDIDIKKDFEMEKENNLNLKKLILQLLSNK